MRRSTSSSRRIALVAALVGALSVCATIASPVAAAAPSAPVSLDLSLTGLSEMVVDDAHSHIFITGYSALSSATYSSTDADSSVVVANMDGTLDSTITGLPGAAGMYLDAPNHTLYVAEYDANAVHAIDTTTLALGTGFDLSADDANCPFDVAKAGGFLWTNIGCGPSNQGGLARIDPGTSDVMTFGSDHGRQLLEASGNSLYTADLFGLHTIERYDVTSGSPVSGGTADPGSNIEDVTLSPNGNDLYVASTSSTDIQGFAGSDLAGGTNYPVGSSPDAVTGSADSSWVIGSNGSDIVVFGAGDPSAKNDFPASEVGGDVAPRGLALSADDATLFSVSGVDGSGTGSPALHLIEDPTVPRSEISLTPPGGSIPLGDVATITGTLTFTDGASAEGQTLIVVRTDPDATQQDVTDVSTTDVSGGFTIYDTPPHAGSATYDVTFEGISGHRAATASAQVTVDKGTATLTLKASKGTVDYGKGVKLTAHLDVFDPGQKVRIFGKPYGGKKRLLDTGAVDGTGTFAISVGPLKKTTFFAVSVEGVDYLRDSSPKVTVLVRPVFAGKMLGGYATKNGYRLYHFTKKCPNSHKGCPVSAFVLAPNHAGKTVTVKLQLHAPSGWVDAGTFKGKLSKKSAISVLWFYRNANVIGIKARVRASFGGDADHTSARSSYLYFLITR